MNIEQHDYNTVVNGLRVQLELHRRNETELGAQLNNVRSLLEARAADKKVLGDAIRALGDECREQSQDLHLCLALARGEKITTELNTLVGQDLAGEILQLRGKRRRTRG